MRRSPILLLLCPCLVVAISCVKATDEEASTKIEPQPTVSQESVPQTDTSSRRQEKDAMNERLAVGDLAPDFEFEMMGGERLTFSQYRKDANGPTVLLFDRAHW